jgi:hypothetical protein
VTGFCQHGTEATVAASANVGVLIVVIIVSMVVSGAEDRPNLGDAQEVVEINMTTHANLAR